MNAANDIHARLREIKNISTLPHVMNRIMSVVTDDQASAKDLAREIRSDQALTSKILKVANSAYYGFHRKIASVDDAVVLLGFREIRSMCLAIAVLGVFDERNNAFFDRRAFWRHSVATATLAEMLAEPYLEERNMAFTAGLLHDLGRATLDQYFPDIWQDICLQVEQKQLHWSKVEQEIIQTDHAEIGFWLAERWDFPQSLTECIRYHHQPSKAAEMPRLTALVHLADILSRRDLDFPPAEGTIPVLDKNVYSLVPLSKERVDSLFVKFNSRREGIQDLIQVMIPA